MHKFKSDVAEIAFDDEGVGEPVLLIHGFASNGRVNWRNTGWIELLVEAGFRTITLDNRGHGESQKFYDPKYYSARDMAEDARALLDHLGIAQAHVMGYSMGARISAYLSIDHPDRVRDAVFAGLAGNMLHGIDGSAAIAEGLKAPSLRDVVDLQAKAFRHFAEMTGSDLMALAACIISSRAKITAEMLAGINVPVLVVAGEKDEISGEISTLTEIIPGSQGLALRQRNHMNAVGDKLYKKSVIDFFRAHPILTR